MEPARSWIREVNSRMRLPVDDGVRRFRLPDVVSEMKGKTRLKYCGLLEVGVIIRLGEPEDASSL